MWWSGSAAEIGAGAGDQLHRSLPSTGWRTGVSILERAVAHGRAQERDHRRQRAGAGWRPSVFYRILQPERTVYRIRDVDGAIATTVAGIVRAEIGKMELDEVQSNRAMLIATIKASVEGAVDDWGIEGDAGGNSRCETSIRRRGDAIAAAVECRA